MYRHASTTCWKGPVSRSRAWWQEEAGEDTGTMVCLENQPGEECLEGDVRWEVVARARRLIAAGAYDAPEILERAVMQLMSRLESP